MPRRAEGRLRPWYGRAGAGPSRGAGSRATPSQTSKRPPGLPSGLRLPTPLHEPSRILRPLAPPPPAQLQEWPPLGHHTATDGCTLARTDTDGRTDPDRYRPTDGPALIQTAQRRTDGPALRRGGPHGTRPISAPGGGAGAHVESGEHSALPQVHPHQRLQLLQRPRPALRPAPVPRLTRPTPPRDRRVTAA